MLYVAFGNAVCISRKMAVILNDSRDLLERKLQKQVP